MDDFLKWLINYPTLITMIVVIILIIVLMYLIAFLQGREISFYPPKIGGLPAKTDTGIKTEKGLLKSKDKDSPRVSLMCSTTHEIEKSEEKKKALYLFYQSLITEFERTPIGINTCGAEPLRSVIIESYTNKIKTLSKSQLELIHNKIRWYWYSGDTVGFGFEPPIYETMQTSDVTERPIKEVLGSNIVIAMMGRTGTREQVERLLQYHNQKQYGIDFNRRPLILLCWFGGTIKDFVYENPSSLKWLLSKYPELEPEKEMKDWYEGNNPQLLAQRLVTTLQRLLGEK